ncbi:MAG: hypothetical protein ACI4MH_05255 [Candidatus Coproplasma sp.]
MIPQAENADKKATAEVIAERDQRFLFAYIFLILCGIALIAGGSFICVSGNLSGILLIICGAILTPTAVACFVLYTKTPKVIITRRKDSLYFKGTEIKISDLSDVDFSTMGKSTCGQIVVVTGEKELKSQFVKNVSQAFTVIYNLIEDKKESDPVEGGNTDDIGNTADIGSEFYRITPDKLQTRTLARKCERRSEFLILLIATSVLGLISGIVAVVFWGTGSGNVIYPAVAFFVFLVAIIFFEAEYIYYKNIPCDVIVCQDDKIQFKNVICRTSEIQLVSYRESRDKYGNPSGYGTVILFVGGKKYKLRYVEDAARAAIDLKRLIAEYNPDISDDEINF